LKEIAKILSLISLFVSTRTREAAWLKSLMKEPIRRNAETQLSGSTARVVTVLYSYQTKTGGKISISGKIAKNVEDKIDNFPNLRVL